MSKINLFNKTAYNLNAKDYAKVANEAAKRSKYFAMDYIAQGIKGNVTKRDVIRICNKDISGMYDEAGDLTAKGLKEMINTVRDMFGLATDEAAKNITVGQLIKKCVADRENMAAKGLNIIA